ncbi:SDR family NAD(P)-dependent oxidoreductase [Arthrobacter sp. RCC_34]|uniref:SDR family NAD(P)-dependent oxidoreductase n=1 Tax=Arthrobacter sp. RCC_34 TaxID=3239230 RepID=UPI0035257D13
MTRLAVVSGTGRGLGRAIAEELLDAGWSVIGLERQPGAPREPRACLTVLRHDVRADVPDDLMTAVGDRPVDLLVNNAAQGAPGGGVQQSDPAGVLASVDVAVAGPMRLVAALLPSLHRAPSPVIVNVSSRLGSVTAQARGEFDGFGTSYAYRISKAAQNMLTVSLAQELSPRIRVLAVHPGRLATGMGRAGADKDPGQAARELLTLVQSDDRRSPRFCSLGEPDLTW